MSTGKRYISILLVVAMICSLIPANVYATQAPNTTEVDSEGTSIESTHEHYDSHSHKMDAAMDETADGQEQHESSTAILQSEGNPIASGVCGSNLTWTLDGNGTLTISGTEAMYNYGEYSNRPPWRSYIDSVTDVVIMQGVTYIGDAAFCQMTNMRTLLIPESVESVGKYAYGSSEILTVMCTAENEPSCVMRYGGPSVCVNVDRYGITDDGQFYCVRKDNTVAVSKYFGDPVEAMEIPEQIEGLPVTEVAGYAYYRNDGIAYITIPDSVTRLGNSAFGDMNSLTGVLVPESVDYIGNYAFQSPSVTVMFRGAELPGTLERYWNNGSEIIMDVRNFGVTDDGFFYCAKNDGTAMVGKYQGTDTEITVPASVDGAPVLLLNNTFRDNQTVTKVIVSEGIEVIGDQCFSRCRNLESVEIASSVKTIGDSCFSNCQKLTDVVLHDGIESIGKSAFNWCSSLETLTIPGSIQTIGIRALSSCEKMKYVLIDADMLPDGLELSEGSYNWNDDGVTIIVGIEQIVDSPDGFSYILDKTGGITITGYQGEETDLVIPDEIDGHPVTQIMGQAFHGYNNLTGVTIPESIEHIGQYAFYQCTYLERIQYNAADAKHPGEYNYIFYDAGVNGDGITLTIGAGVRWIPHHLFCPTHYIHTLVDTSGRVTEVYTSDNDPYITSILFEEGSICTEIGAQSFAYLGSLTKIKIPASVKDIRDKAFEWCTDLNEIVFEGGFFSAPNGQFTGVIANVYYPADNMTWTADKLQSYGGILTWKPYCRGTHTEVIDAAIAATCETNGLTEGKHCSVCNKVLVAQEMIPATGHDYQALVTDPTCSEQGYTTHTCSNCNDVYVDSYVDAVGHVFGPWEVIEEPKPGQTGSQRRTCTVCGHTETEEIPALDIVYGDVNGDGRINTLDLIILRQYLAGWDVELDIAAADVNGNGTVNTLDLIILRQYLAGWDVTLGPKT